MFLKEAMTPQIFQEWLKDKHELADSSIYYYVLGARRFLARNPDLEKLEDYNNFLIDVMIKKRGYNYYAIIKKFIEYKITDATTRNKILTGMIKPRVYNDIKVVRRSLREEEIMTVINNLKKKKHRIIALIQTLTGVRAGDIIRLKRTHVVPEEYKENPVLKLVILGKRKKTNVVHLHDSLAQNILMEYMTANINYDDYVFIELGNIGKAGGVYDYFRLEKYNYWCYWEDLKQALQTSGIAKEDFATHDFRRCFARKVWEKYKDIQVLQHLLNHQNVNVTLRYLEHSGLKNIDYHYAMQK